MKKRYLSLAITLCLAASSFSSVVSAKPNGIPANEKTRVIDNLKKNNGGNFKIDMHENQGLQVFLSGKLSEKKSINGDNAKAFLEENKALFGLHDFGNNFKVVSVTTDALGFTQVKLNQLIAGSPVRGRDIIVQFDKNGYVSSITGSFENKVKDVTKKGNKDVSENQAIDIAKKEFKFNSLRKAPKVEKQVIVKDDTAYEVYNVNIQFNDPEITNYDVLVDTSTGNIIDKINNIQYDGAVTGSGTDVNGRTKPLNLYLSSGSYQMKDTTKAMTGQILTYTAKNQQVEPGTLVANTSSTFNTESLKAPVSAHYNAGIVYDFYKNLFGRNSIDNNGMSIISTTHYDNAYNNAFWDGSQMVYGDGDGSTFTYLSGDLDVVAHELTHGVTSYSANLNYSNQSGALNESMSDVLGVLCETYDKYNVKGGGTWSFNSADWVVGDEVYTPGTSGDALRSLANPKLYSQPDNMSGYVNTTSDNGGVHTNSGIPNKAAYLIASTIGNEKTSRIYYRGLTTYMTSTTDFLGARNALVKAATDLYGASSAEVTAVNNAFDTVGVKSSSTTDPYEPNDSLSQAYAITSGTTYSSYISSSSDVDCYKLTGRSGYTISASLTNLPKDYDFYLYNSSGNLVASSENGSTTSESISYKATYSGTYYLVVEGYNGAYSTATKYNLRATF